MLGSAWSSVGSAPLGSLVSAVAPEQQTRRPYDPSYLGHLPKSVPSPEKSVSY